MPRASMIRVHMSPHHQLKSRKKNKRARGFWGKKSFRYGAFKLSYITRLTAIKQQWPSGYITKYTTGIYLGADVDLQSGILSTSR